MSVFARRRGSNIRQSGEHRATFVPKTPSLHARDTNLPIVGRRFLCFVSLSPLDKEMKCRHAQWLIVIKNRDNISRAQVCGRTPRPRPTERALKPPSAHAQKRTQWLRVI